MKKEVGFHVGIHVDVRFEMVAASDIWIQYGWAGSRRLTRFADQMTLHDFEIWMAYANHVRANRRRENGEARTYMGA